jgi:hypothetical protein
MVPSSNVTIVKEMHRETGSDHGLFCNTAQIFYMKDYEKLLKTQT